MRQIFISIVFLFLFSGIVASQQKMSKLSANHELLVLIASNYKLPEPQIKEKPVRWTTGVFTQVGFSQVSLSNWAAGGFSTISMNGYINYYANYNYDIMYWENRVQLAYGFVQAFGENYKKSDDKIIIDSKVGTKALNKIYFSAFFNFRSQFSPGFIYPSTGSPIMTSLFLAPGYFSLGIGMDYKPDAALNINFSPLTSNMVVVQKPELRKRYGNQPDQLIKLELGAQLKSDLKVKIAKTTSVNSTLILFSDFLGTLSNIKVNWETMIDSKITKFLSANLRTTLLYDDNVLIANSTGVLAPRVQFKELLSLGFSYTFGNFKK